jgi:hypothetical protein
MSFGLFFFKLNNMEIKVIRPKIQDTTYTISDLFVNDVFFSNVMEDRDRNLHSSNPEEIKAKKIKHETAIPYGKYEVVMSYSERFKMLLPLLTNVPGYDGIRIHAGNTEADSSGCLLPGIKSGKTVINSRSTTSKLIKTIQDALKKEKVFITIVPSN